MERLKYSVRYGKWPWQKYMDIVEHYIDQINGYLLILIFDDGTMAYLNMRKYKNIKFSKEALINIKSSRKESDK